MVLHPIDLRSDTVTQPTPEMRAAMFDAPLGDDVYGEDPTINRLEETVSQLVGHEAALFTPSGTMANQIAINLHTRPGDSVIAEQDSHVYLYEAGAAGALSGIQFNLLPFAANFSTDAILEAYREPGLHYASTSLLVIENTHNRGSGKVLDLHMLRRIQQTGRSLGLKLHCDGARLWNAAQVLKISEKELASGFDTVSVCFSKGLGAPVGSALCGPKELINRARKVRKRWGGGMRQGGFLAAAALYGLQHHRSRLRDDHARIALLKAGLDDLGRQGLPFVCSLPTPHTNILYFDVVGIEGARFSAALTAQGILMNHLGNGRFRAVTHLHITDDCISQTLCALKQIALS